MAWKKDKSERNLNDWFTPRSPAIKNYVRRGNLDKTIFREFSQKGGQILVYGPTGAGKTSLVLDNLNQLKKRYDTNYIRITMTDKTTIDTFIADAASKLNLVKVVQTMNGSENNNNIQGSVSVLKWITGKITTDSSTTSTSTVEQYTGSDDFNILEKALFERNTVLVVDDMENLSEKSHDLRIRLAEIAKNMSDDAINYEDSFAKIVFVGIADTADQLWSDVGSLKSRLSTIEVPYLNEDESTEIIKTGWDKAHLRSTPKQVKRTVFISTGIGHVVHELGQKTGYAALDDDEVTVDGDKAIIKDPYIDDAIRDMFETNKLVYAKLLSNAKNKRSTRTAIRNLVLYVMANSNEMNMTTQEILQGVNELREDGANKGTNTISPALSDLKSDKLNVLSNHHNTWQFVDPIFKAYVRENAKELIPKKQ